LSGVFGQFNSGVDKGGSLADSLYILWAILKGKRLKKVVAPQG
jgi:hypothetical protein